MNIIIDKCFLFGTSPKSISELLSKHRLMMPESLFLEILTSDDENHIKKCFEKFPQKENPVDLLPSPGNLMYFEKTNHKPCTPIENCILNIRYEFNPNLRGEGYKKIVKKVEVSLDEWKQNISQETAGFAQVATTVIGWFPELKEKKKISNNEMNAAMKKVSEDESFIKNVYSVLQKEILKNEGEEWPNPQIINKEWAIFRYLQFHLIGSLDYVWRYGKHEKETSKRLVNALLDIEYCILGSLADALATRDKTMENFYKTVCPEKILIN